MAPKWIVLTVILILAVAAIWAMRKTGVSASKSKPSFRPWYPEK